MLNLHQRRPKIDYVQGGHSVQTGTPSLAPMAKGLMSAQFRMEDIPIMGTGGGGTIFGPAWSHSRPDSSRAGVSGFYGSESGSLGVLSGSTDNNDNRNGVGTIPFWESVVASSNRDQEMPTVYENSQQNRFRQGLTTTMESHYSKAQEQPKVVSKFFFFFFFFLKKKGTCPLCFIEETDLVVMRGCMHACCKECLHGYLCNNLKNISMYPRHCWSTNCNALIAYHDAEYVLTEEELIAYDQTLVKSSVHDTEQI
ncbi:hypothetical protein RFI_35695, partial [Reticulomyxa filosa]